MEKIISLPPQQIIENILICDEVRGFNFSSTECVLKETEAVLTAPVTNYKRIFFYISECKDPVSVRSNPNRNPYYSSININSVKLLYQFTLHSSNSLI